METSALPTIPTHRSWTARGLEWLDWLIPGELTADPDVHVRARLLVLFPLILDANAPVFAASYAVLGDWWSALVLIVAAILLSFSPLILRFTHTIAPAAHWMGAALAWTLFSLAYRTNVDHSVVAWFGAVPVMLGFLVGLSAGLLWLFGVGLIIGLLFVLQAEHLLASNPVVTELPAWLDFLGYMGVTAVVLLFSSTQDYLRARAIGALSAANIKLEASTRAAERANRLKSEFLANMSHEIRTPMNGVIGMGELLRGSKLGEQERRYVDVIVTCGEGLLDIINDILDMSKIEAGQLVLESIDFDLRSCIEGVLDLTRGRAQAKGLSLSLDFDARVSRAVRGDAGRLRQILLNLTSNAIKFTERGHVHIRVEPATASQAHDRPVRIVVEDTGIGIPDDRVSALFQSFSQVDASTTRRFGGTGLGLVISRQLARAMNGDISVESAVGVGSIFTVTMNLPPATSAVAVRPTTPQPRATSSGARILLVEDNPINQMVANNMLVRLGYVCDLAESGRHALDALQTHDYDAVLMDCQMPELDGYETTREVRRREGDSRRTLIIAMTASAMDDDRLRCLGAGMDGYISKPVTMNRLYETLRAHHV